MFGTTLPRSTVSSSESATALCMRIARSRATVRAGSSVSWRIRMNRPSGDHTGARRVPGKDTMRRVRRVTVSVTKRSSDPNVPAVQAMWLPSGDQSGDAAVAGTLTSSLAGDPESAPAIQSRLRAIRANARPSGAIAKGKAPRATIRSPGEGNRTGERRGDVRTKFTVALNGISRRTRVATSSLHSLPLSTYTNDSPPGSQRIRVGVIS